MRLGASSFFLGSTTSSTPFLWLAWIRPGSTVAGSAMYEAGCGDTGPGDPSGNERVVAFQLDEEVNLELRWTQFAGSDHVFAISLEEGDTCDEYIVGCYDPAGDTTGSTQFNRIGPGNFMLIIDAYNPGDEGQVDVTLEATPI